VKYKATADWPVLGRKLKKDINKVKNGLPNVPSDDVKKYVETGELLVEGIPLGKGELTVTRWVDTESLLNGLTKEQKQEGIKYESNSDNEVIVVLDINQRPDLMEEGLAREIINRVQRMRKKANLVPSDEVTVYFKPKEDVEFDELDRVIIAQESLIKKVIRQCPVKEVEGQNRKEGKELLVEVQSFGHTGEWVFTMIEGS